MPDHQADLAENARLTHLVRALGISVALQAERAAAEAAVANTWRHEANLLRASLFWRLTAPARLALDLARGRAPFGLPLRQGLARAREIAAQNGWREAGHRARGWLRRHRPPKADIQRPPGRASTVPPEEQAGPVEDSPYRRRLAEPPARVLVQRVVIIAELTLPQCAKYRVWQKQEHLRALGIPCKVVNWHDHAACRSAAALATAVILYRVPGFPPVMETIAECRRLRVPLWWEVDDLIFDEAEYLQNRNIATLDPALRESILSGVPLYRRAMLACDRGIASTTRLAKAMRDAGLPDAVVVENALDEETLAIAARLRAAPRPPRADIIITYGSGTRTHDADFAVAAAALLAVMHARPNVRLRIVGDLTLPALFDTINQRIEHLPKVHYAAYLDRLADSDISIAPLEDTIFNDAKSNIKFLEAAVLGLPSVCSPRATFAEVVRHGENGLLAGNQAAWETCLLDLIDDPACRSRLGAAALQTAIARYAPGAIAEHQLRPLFAGEDARPPMPLRVLMANVYFWPKSFGGATIVAEEMAGRLAARGDTAVHIVTGADDLPPADMMPGQWLLRYDRPLDPHAPPAHEQAPESPAMMVAALALPGADAILPFDNPSLGTRFADVLDAVDPDVVHLHSIQGLSAAAARACAERGIPYVVTLHDAWWICARQFMVQGDGRYCFQTRIDIRVCEACVPGAHHLKARYDMLLASLHGAALLLAPSEAHRQLYLAQGFAPGKIQVAPNGVRHPAAPPAPRPREAGRLTFAYVGGAVDVKGYPLVRSAFESLTRADWRLVVVDNTLNLGFSSIDLKAWKTAGTVDAVAAYTQDTMDEFFAGIDVLLFPSQWKESFGLTVREALLRGVWVIATAGGGPAEAIVPGMNGTLIPLDGRTAPLLAAIETLLDNPAQLAGAASHAIANPSAIIDFAAQAETLHAILQQAAQTHAKRQAA